MFERDGKDDYSYIDENGGVWLWYNRGAGDTSTLIDGIRFADIDGDGVSYFESPSHGNGHHSHGGYCDRSMANAL